MTTVTFPTNYSIILLFPLKKVKSGTVCTTSVLTLILEFTISGPHHFQMDSIILQNSQFRGPVEHMKKP